MTVVRAPISDPDWRRRRNIIKDMIAPSGGRNGIAHDRAGFIALAKDIIRHEQAYWHRHLTKPSPTAHHKEPWGWRYTHHHSALADLIVKGALSLTANFDTTPIPLSIVAIGGYGRGELCPFSDLDILFLTHDSAHNNKNDDTNGNHVQETIEKLLCVLWDIGLNLGYSVRSIDECLRDARSDWKLRSSFLDMRHLVGDHRGYAGLKRHFHARLVAGREPDITDQKWLEMNARHARADGSRYLLEPNIKEGKGALRDIQTIWWIARAHCRIKNWNDLVRLHILTPDEKAMLQRSIRFLLSLRCHLHLLCGRGEERLTFDMQRRIAADMGDHEDQAQQRLMRRYFLTVRDVGNLVHIFRSLFPSRRTRSIHTMSRQGWSSIMRRRDFGRGIQIKRGQLYLRDDNIADDPLLLLELFHVSQKENLHLHHETRRLVQRNISRIDPRFRQDRQANRLFLSILTGSNAYAILSLMNDIGVLGRFLPGFGQIVGSMQYDLYHAYTIDEHTLRLIRHLQHIEDGTWTRDHPLASLAIRKVETSRRVLYVAGLLHDLAKGGKDDHSIKGAKAAEEICPQMGLDAAETDMVVWLIRHHLVMSHTAFRHDIDDEKTLDDFITTVQSLERLRLLLILTVADIRAVSPTTWTAWKKDLLSRLYRNAENILAGRRDVFVKGHPKQAIAAWRAHITDHPNRCDRLSKDAQIHFAQLTPKRFWLAESLQTQDQCALVVMRAESLHHRTAAKNARHEGHPPQKPEEQKPDDRQNRGRHFFMSLLDGSCATTGRHTPPQSGDPHPDQSGDGLWQLVIYADSYPRFFSDIAGSLTLAGGDITGARTYQLHNGKNLAVFLIQDTVHWISGENPISFNQEGRLARFRSLLERAGNGDIDLEKRLQERAPSLPRRATMHVPARVNIDNQLSRTSSVIEAVGKNRPGLLFALTRALADHGVRISSTRIVSYGVRVVDAFYVRDAFGLKIEKPQKIALLRRSLIAAMQDPPQNPPATATTKVPDMDPLGFEKKRSSDRPNAS